MKNFIKLCLVVMMLFSISCSNDNDSSNRNDETTADVINAISGDIVGTSTLHRNKNGITVNFKTTNLKPSYAYTLWWIIWNNPQECGTPGECEDTDFGNAGAVGVDVLYATGLVANDSGIGNFSASLNVDDDSESMNAIFELPLAGGLQSGNALSAEVHVVLRSHGPVIPDQVDEQISGYFGGCTTFFDPFTETPDEVGECGDIEFSVHAPIF